MSAEGTACGEKPLVGRVKHTHRYALIPRSASCHPSSGGQESLQLSEQRAVPGTRRARVQSLPPCNGIPTAFLPIIDSRSGR